MKKKKTGRERLDGPKPTKA